MASTFTTLGIEKMATGENAGTWGDKTNTNLDIVNTAISGYVEQAVTSGGTLALSITDGASTATAQNAVIKLTGTITGNSIVTVPDSVEKVYIVTNGTSGAYTVQFKTASGTGVTFGVSEKTTKLLYSDGTNIVDAGFSGALDVEGRELILDADGDTSLTADTDDQIDIKIAGADDFQFTANTFTAQSGSSIVVPDGGLTFGSTAITSTAAELNLLDGVSGLVQADLTKLAAVDSTAAELNIVDGGTSATSTTVADADRVVLNDNGTMVQVAVTDLAAYFDDEITAMPNLTSVGTLTTLTVDNIIINGANIGHTSDADALAIDSSGNVTASQNLIVTGDLTVSGDDITMGTNTAGNILVADGTNFNSIAVGGLSEISTVADDDVFLAVDTSGGGLKKIARSSVVSGLATSSAISNVADDSTPQLGGNLDMNGNDIVTTSNADLELAPNGTGHVTVRGNTNQGTIQFNCENNSHGQQVKAAPHSESASNVLTLPSTGGDARLVSAASTATLTNKTLTAPKIADGGFIADANGNELVVFQTTGSAVNEIEITNNATGSNPIIAATGGDTNIGIALTPKGTGEIVIGAGNLNYAGTAITSTGAELNILDGVTSTAAELNALDGITAVVGELNALDIGSTAVGTAVASKAVILDSNKDYTGIRNFTISGELDAATLDISGAIDVAGTTNLDVVDIDGAVNMATTALVTGVLTTTATSIFNGGFTANNDCTINTDDNGVNLTLQSTDDDELVGPKLLLRRHSGSPADNDVLGRIEFHGQDDNDQQEDLVKLEAIFTDVSNGSEDAQFNIDTKINGTNRSRIDMSPTETVFNEDSVDLDFRVETNAEANAFKIDGGSETAAFGVPVTFNDAANVAQQALTSSSNAVAWDATAKPNAFHLTTENTTFSAPSNAVEGAFICLEINYNGSHTIAFNTVFEFAASTAPTTTDTDGKTDILVFRYNGAVWQEVGRTLNLSES